MKSIAPVSHHRPQPSNQPVQPSMGAASPSAAETAGTTEREDESVEDAALSDPLSGLVRPTLSPQAQAIHDANHQVAARLIRAIAADDPAQVDDILRLAPLVNACLPNGQTPLQMAVLLGQPKVVACLLQRKDLDPNKAGADGWTPLRLAAHKNQLGIAADLLKHPRTNPNDAFPNGTTPFYLAVANNHLNMAQLLAHKGADIRQPKGGGFTPLHAACVGGHARTLHWLLDTLKRQPFGRRQRAFTAALNQTTAKGETPLQLAVCNKDTKAVQRLLKQKGIDPNRVNAEGWTPLHVAADMGARDTVNALLQHPQIQVNAPDPSGMSPLFKAVQRSERAIAALLLGHGADIHQRTDDGSSILEACVQADDATLQWLLARPELLQQKGQAITLPTVLNQADATGITPMHVAAEMGNTTMVQTLLRHGARANAVDSNGDMPVHRAVHEGHLETVQWLLPLSQLDINSRLASGETLLHLAILSDNEAPLVAYLLAQEGIDPNRPDKDGWAPLHRAARHGLKDAVLHLLAHPDINVLQEGPHGQTVLHCAAICTKPKPLIEALHATVSPDRFLALKNTQDHWQRWPVSRLAERPSEDDLIALLTPSTRILPMALTPPTYRRGWILTGPQMPGADSMKKAGQLAGMEMHAYGDGKAPLSWRELNQLDIRPGDVVIVRGHSEWNADRKEVLMELGDGDRVPLVEVARMLLEKGVLRALFLGCEVNMAMAPLLNRFAQDPTIRPLKRPRAGYKGMDYTIVGREGTNLGALNHLAATLWLEDCAQLRTGHASQARALLSRSAQPMRTLTWNARDKTLTATRRPKMKADGLGHLSPGLARTLKEQLLLPHAFNGKPSEVEALLGRHQVDPDTTSVFGETPLALACYQGHTAVVERLLKHKANVRLADHEGIFPLYRACQQGHAAICQHLLDHGADIEQELLPPYSSSSALLIAIELGHTAIVKMLLDAGADPYKHSDRKTNAWDVARHNNRADILKLLPP